MNELFKAVSNQTIATKDNVRTPMTPATIAKLSKDLHDKMCMNVYPNKFDIKTPYNVSIRFDKKNHSHGTFKDLEVAKMVGNIASLATFGRKAMASVIVDVESVEQHPEMVTWLADERNVDTIAKATAVYGAPQEPVQDYGQEDMGELQQIG